MKQLDSPDEKRTFDKGRLELAGVGGATVGRLTLGPGDAHWIAPGRDVWVVGDEPYVGLDFTGAADYAKVRTNAEPVDAPGRGRPPVPGDPRTSGG